MTKFVYILKFHSTCLHTNMLHLKIPFYVFGLVCKAKYSEVFGFVILRCLYKLSLFCVDIRIPCVTHVDLIFYVCISQILLFLLTYVFFRSIFNY